MSLQYIADFESECPTADGSQVLVVQWVNDRVVLTGHLDGWLRAWDTSNGRLLAQVHAHVQSTNSVTTSEDGKAVLSSSLDGSVSLWSISDLPQLSVAADKEIRSDEGQVDGSSPQDNVDAAATSAAHWTPTSQVPSVRFPPECPDAFVTALHPSGRFFASTGQGASLSLHSAQPDSFGKHVVTSPPPSSIHEPSSTSSTYGICLSFSPSGQIVAVGTLRGHVHLYHLQSDNELRLVATVSSHAAPIRSVTFDSIKTFKGQQDSVVYIGGDDGIITMHDVLRLSSHASTAEPDKPPRELMPVGVLRGHKSGITALAPVPPAATSLSASHSAMASMLSSTSRDGTLRIWDLRAIPKACVFLTSPDLTPTAAFEAATRSDNERPVEAGQPEQTVNGDADGAQPSPPETAAPAQPSAQAPSQAQQFPRISMPPSSIAWRRSPPFVPAAPASPARAGPAFVVAGEQKLVWYRMAGLGAVDL